MSVGSTKIDLLRINANLLVALDLLLNEGSVRRAAERQGVTPSAMSHSLRSLRDLFDDELLTRTQRGMVPTPLGAELRAPLRRALRDLSRAVSERLVFDPARAERGFVVAAPDFISTLLMPHVVRVLAEQAPGVDVEVRPVARRGADLILHDVAALAEGDLDLVIGAFLDDVPGIFCERLYDERFVCVVREDHPEVGEEMDLATYARLSHALITITDERSPTLIDRELEAQGLRRRVAFRTRYFTSAPLVVADSDLILTCPFQLARYFSRRVPLRIVETPLPLSTYPEHIGWHPRFDADPALRWLRGVFGEAARLVST